MSEKLKWKGKEASKKVLEAAMRVKIKDEQRYREELARRRNLIRKEIQVELGENSRPYRRRMKDLKEKANEERREYEEKYSHKLRHLKEKYMEEEREKHSRTPEELKEFAQLKVFNKEEFDEININIEEVLVVSKNITLSEDEKAVLRMHTKFSVIQYLNEKETEFEQELAYAKVRMQRKNELEEIERRKKEREEEGVWG